jgi:hypothetical protein
VLQTWRAKMFGWLLILWRFPDTIRGGLIAAPYIFPH